MRKLASIVAFSSLALAQQVDWPNNIKRKPVVDIRQTPLNAKCDGSDESSVLIAVDTSYSANTISIPCLLTINSNVTLSNALTLRFEKGGMIAVQTTKTLTMNATIEAGMFQIFSSAVGYAGHIVGVKATTLPPQWWGAVCNGIADDTNAFTSMSYAVTTQQINISNGTCLINSSISISSPSIQIAGGSGIKAGSGATVSITGAVVAGDYQIFSGDGSFSLLPSVKPIWFDGTDIGVKTNKAIAAACSAPCNIELPKGGTYSYSTTINVSNVYTNLDLGGSKITYTGTGNAILVPTSNIYYGYISGVIHDGEIVGNSNANSVGIRQQSRVGMMYERLRIRDFTGANSSCMEWDNTVGDGPGTVQFNEQNTIIKSDLENCTKGLRWRVIDGTNSFAYNEVIGVHFGVNDGQIGFSMEGTGVTQTLFVNGGLYELRFNLNTASVAGTAISLSGGADWERSTVAINGEKTSGAATSYGLSRDSASVFNNFGFFEIDGTSNTANAGIQILQPEGWHTSVAPVNTYSADFNGLVRFRQNTVLMNSAHYNMEGGGLKGDTSFSMLLPSSFDRTVLTFTTPWNTPPSCVVTPNTKILGSGGVGIGTWWIEVNDTDLTVRVSDVQGSNVTFFAHCMGQPN